MSREWHERPAKAILKHEARLRHRRERQRDSAYAFLVSGENEEAQTPPSYGETWDRTYHPEPYAEAEPGSTTLPLESYVDTGIGFLYGLAYCERFAHELAGWNFPFNVLRDPTRELKKDGGHRTIQVPRLKIKSETRTSRR